MDADRLATLLRALTASPSRRATLRTLGGVGLLSLLHCDEGAAKRKRRKKRKKRKKRKQTQGGCQAPNLSNGSCATACDSVDDCPSGFSCTCSLTSTDGPKHCVQVVSGCVAVPQPCTSTNDCPPSQHCSLIGCGPGGTLENRCRPLC